nr:glutaredoxin arsenate reductase-like [Nerophis lumbriciformis]
MKRAVFLCTENSNRSQMAEAFARLHGSGVVEAWSAGSAASGVVNPKAVAAMAEKGYDLARHRSQSTAELPSGPFDFVVTMGCGDQCPWVAGDHREDWGLPDPKAMAPAEFNRVRDEIERRVLDLVGRATDRSQTASEDS